MRDNPGNGSKIRMGRTFHILVQYVDFFTFWPNCGYKQTNKNPTANNKGKLSVIACSRGEPFIIGLAEELHLLNCFILFQFIYLEGYVLFCFVFETQKHFSTKAMVQSCLWSTLDMSIAYISSYLCYLEQVT